MTYQVFSNNKQIPNLPPWAAVGLSMRWINLNWPAITRELRAYCTEHGWPDYAALPDRYFFDNWQLLDGRLNCRVTYLTKSGKRIEADKRFSGLGHQQPADYEE